MVLSFLAGGCAGRGGGGLFLPVVGVTNAAVAATVKNAVTVTNLVPVIVETTNLVCVTNLVGGGVTEGVMVDVSEIRKKWTITKPVARSGVEAPIDASG